MAQQAQTLRFGELSNTTAFTFRAPSTSDKSDLRKRKRSATDGYEADNKDEGTKKQHFASCRPLDHAVHGPNDPKGPGGCACLMAPCTPDSGARSIWCPRPKSPMSPTSQLVRRMISRPRSGGRLPGLHLKRQVCMRTVIFGNRKHHCPHGRHPPMPYVNRPTRGQLLAMVRYYRQNRVRTTASTAPTPPAEAAKAVLDAPTVDGPLTEDEVAGDVPDPDESTVEGCAECEAQDAQTALDQLADKYQAGDRLAWNKLDDTLPFASASCSMSRSVLRKRNSRDEGAAQALAVVDDESSPSSGSDSSASWSSLLHRDAKRLKRSSPPSDPTSPILLGRTRSEQRRVREWLESCPIEVAQNLEVRWTDSDRGPQPQPPTPCPVEELEAVQGGSVEWPELAGWQIWVLRCLGFSV